MQTDSSSVSCLSTWAVVECCTGLMGILMISLDFAKILFFFSHNGIPSVFKNSFLPPVWLYSFYLYRVLYLTMLHPV